MKKSPLSAERIPSERERDTGNEQKGGRERENDLWSTLQVLVKNRAQGLPGGTKCQPVSIRNQDAEEVGSNKCKTERERKTQIFSQIKRKLLRRVVEGGMKLQIVLMRKWGRSARA